MKCIKVSFCFFIFLCATGFVSVAQETVPLGVPNSTLSAPNSENVQAALDAAKAANFKKLSFVLRSAKKAELPLIESKVLEMVPMYLDRSDYATASGLIETILENNIDNTEAQKALIKIEDIKRDIALKESLRMEIETEARIARERLEAERLEIERVENERLATQQLEKKKLEIEREKIQREESQRLERQRLDAEIEKNLHAKRVASPVVNRFSAMFDMSPAEVLIGSSSFADTYTGSHTIQSKYGFRMGFEGQYKHPLVKVLFTSNFDILPVPLAGNESRNSFKIRSSIGSPLLGFPLFFNFGYTYFEYAEKNGLPTSSNMFSKAGCLTVGLGMEQIRITESLDISARAVWLPLSFSDPLISFAMDSDISLRWKLMKINSAVWLYANTGSVTTLIFATGGFEYSEILYVSIGVHLD